jgi:hypothetical protein
MVKLAVADSTGTYKTAKGLWVVDSTGKYRPAKVGSVAIGDGSYHMGYTPGPAFSTVTLVKGSPSYQKAVLTWTAGGASTYKVFQQGSSTALYTGSGSTYTFTGAPATKYTFFVRAIAADGITYTDSSPISIVLDALAAPANFRKTSGDWRSSVWAWNAVTGATSYDLVDTLAGNAVKGNTSSTGLSEYPLNDSTTYERGVRAKLGSATSGVSNKIRYTTPAQPGPGAGTYTYNANTQTDAWAPGYGVWRPTSDGIIHGNGDIWGGANGNQITFFFYGNRPWYTALHGGRCTRLKIQLKRDSSAGYSSAQACRFGLHNYTVRPGGAPLAYSAIDAGSLSWGEEAAIDLPVSWGQAMIDTASIGGITWGFVPGRYMRGPAPAAYAPQGRLIFTIA